MDTMEILLLCVVGFAVVVFLCVDSLDLSKKSRKGCDDDSGIEVHQVGSYLVESVEATSVGADEKISSNFKNPNLANPEENKAEESGFCNRKEGLDDWEGIERTELEKLFGEAVVFMSHKSNADKISGDVKLQLYALQKVALEGPCHGSQPMALKVSARAKWTAWQKQGDMSPEMAMEKYVNILAEATPEWKGMSSLPTAQAIDGKQH